MEIGAFVTYALLFTSLYFEVFLLVSFLERRRARTYIPAPADDASLPRVAIVVPCFNEERGVASTLTSLLALHYPQDKLEIIVVDDGSRDSTYAIAEQFGGDPRVRIFRKENGGKYTAMNLGLRETNAELIGCLDADSIVEPEALRCIVRMFENGKVAAVTPGIHARKPETLLQHIQKAEYHLNIFSRFVLAALGSTFIAPGPFSVFRTAVVRELGGWREGHSTEDMEIALRIQAAGHLIGNAPGAVVHTATPRTLRDLFRQRVRWTYGFLRNTSDHRYMLLNRRYGNLGIFILPFALISIGTGVYFFILTLSHGLQSLANVFDRAQVMGAFPSPHMELFYIETSAILFLMYISLALIFVLICIGSLIGTGSRRPPIATPLFMLTYSFLVPLWVGTAVVRALLRTGVSWR